MPQLVLSLLGQVQFVLRGQLLTGFESDKARALLIYLAMNAGRSHRREHLCALLWPDQPEKRALQNLRQSLHRLRHSLQQSSDAEASVSFLLVTPQTVQFNAGSDHALDVRAFEALMAEAAHHRHRRREMCRACMERLTRAAQLYQGDFLAGFAIKDSAAFEEWVALERERWRLQALDALGALTAYHEHRGEDAQAEAYARRQLELEPWQEPARRQLMRALVRQGKRAAALAQYKTCVQILERELGIEPEAETTALFEQIKAEGHRSGGARERTAPLLNFPARLTSFVGRELELTQIGETLQDPNCRLLTLIGTGGSGKTRLSAEAARTEGPTFQDGACFVALAPVTSGELIPSAIANALGLSLLPGQDPRAQMLAFLHDKEMLIVLDNFEHVLGGEGSAALLVSEIVHACPQVSVLVTSRETLNLYGERVFPVWPLPVPAQAQASAQAQGAMDVSAAAIAAVPAVDLFVQRSQAASPTFRLDDGNAAPVGEICRRLDGLPLAIELAAAHIQDFQPQEMLAQLNPRLRLLTDGPRDFPARHQTLWNTMAWSHDQLAPCEQLLFRRLAVFGGGFNLDSVQAICNADGALSSVVNRTLSTLAGKRLIHPTRFNDGAQDGEDVRHDMLQTMREFAQVKLADAGEVDAVHQWHFEFFLHRAEEAEAKLPSAERARWFDWLDAERDNLTDALEWAFTAAPARALQLAVALGTMWEVRTRIFTGRVILERALSRSATAPQGLRAKAMYWAGRLALRQGNLCQAKLELNASLNLYRDKGDQGGAGFALNDLGSVAHWQGDYDEAEHVLAESLTIRQALGNAWWIAQTLNNLGMTAYRRGDEAGAQQYFESCLDHFQKTGTEMPLAWPLGGLGQVAFARRDYLHARRLLEESVAIWRKHRFDWALGMRLNDLGLLLWSTGEYVNAQRCHQESLTIARDIGDRRGLSFALEGLARVAVSEGDIGEAVRLFDAAEAQRQASCAALGSIESAIHQSIVTTLRPQSSPAGLSHPSKESPTAA